MRQPSLLPLLSLLPAALAQVKCPIIFDGRVPANTPLTYFDSANPLFSADYVKGNNLTFSQILRLPNIPSSKFDGNRTGVAYVPIEPTISDKSIFNDQLGFRRVGLMFPQDSGNDTSDVGVKTIHFSVKQDLQRPMNLSHEYLNVWHETADFAAAQFTFEAGTLLGTNGSDKTHFKVLGRTNNILFSVPINYKTWQNFAVTTDHDKNTLKVYYSLGYADLKAVTADVANDNSGGGAYQIGMLKKPTGTDDVVHSGYQESGIDEGQIYGGLFVEDSANGCIST